MLTYLLADDANGTPWLSFVILGVLIVGMIALFLFSGRRRKKQEEEAKNLIDAVKPGNKVKTIGGICGIVVEVDTEENTFVLETGTEQSGKCFIKFDRQAIYQTDAVVDKKDEKQEKEELPAENPEELKAETEDKEALTEKEETPSEDKKD